MLPLVEHLAAAFVIPATRNMVYPLVTLHYPCCMSMTEFRFKQNGSTMHRHASCVLQRNVGASHVLPAFMACPPVESHCTRPYPSICASVTLLASSTCSHPAALTHPHHATNNTSPAQALTPELLSSHSQSPVTDAQLLHCRPPQSREDPVGYDIHGRNPESMQGALLLCPETTLKELSEQPQHLVGLFKQRTAQADQVRLSAAARC
jgi:hypothetical protein